MLKEECTFDLLMMHHLAESNTQDPRNDDMEVMFDHWCVNYCL